MIFLHGIWRHIKEFGFEFEFVTFSLSVAKQSTRRIAAGKNLEHGDMHFLVKRKESDLLFRNRFSSG